MLETIRLFPCVQKIVFRLARIRDCRPREESRAKLKTVTGRFVFQYSKYPDLRRQRIRTWLYCLGEKVAFRRSVPPEVGRK